jgi:hypothetical protein
VIRTGDIIENPVTGERIRFLVAAADTNGEYTKIECTVEPNGAVAAAHKHPYQTETFEVVSGKQFEIDRTLNHHTGGLYGDGRGWFAWPAPEYEQVIRPTDWNDMLIKVEGNDYLAFFRPKDLAFAVLSVAFAENRQARLRDAPASARLPGSCLAGEPPLRSASRGRG